MTRWITKHNVVVLAHVAKSEALCFLYDVEMKHLNLNVLFSPMVV